MENFSELWSELQVNNLIWAARYPLLLTAVSMPLAVIFGLVLAVMRRSRYGLLSWPAATYIEIIRGTPLYVQLFLVYYSLPLLGEEFTLKSFNAAILCLAGNYAAYEAEIHRAGLDAIDKGQREAALSIGMTEWQAFRRVVLPQAFRTILPPVINDSIAMLKDSCLASAIGVPELLTEAKRIGLQKGDLAPVYVAAALIYMVMSLVFYAIGKYVESRLRARGGQELHLETVHGH